MYLILTHDVDWPIHGPGREHILARLDRFDESVKRRILEEDFNPYFGIPLVMEAEERVGVRSTFFFRPLYDDGTGVECYRDVLRELVQGGWEIGVHLNSVESTDEAMREKRRVEKAASTDILGSRVHYLRITESDYPKLREAGILYDSSLKKFKDKITLEDTGYRVISGVTVFPITVMDAYLFTYMGLKEDQVVEVVVNALLRLALEGVEYATILWHDNSMLMRGGRVYPRLLEELMSLDTIEVVRGIDAYRMVKR